MPEIPFTQYLRPNGRQVAVTIDRPLPIFEKAARIVEAGYRLECEELVTGEVFFTISDDDDDYAGELCANGPEVLEAVDRLINKFPSLNMDPDDFS